MLKHFNPYEPQEPPKSLVSEESLRFVESAVRKAHRDAQNHAARFPHLDWSIDLETGDNRLVWKMRGVPRNERSQE